jgi:G3E family GTPase
MAEINIDTKLILNQDKIKQVEEKLVSLENGCICCTLREDLLIEISELAKENKFDYCLIESTGSFFFNKILGIGEPMNVAETFTFTLNEKEDEEEEEEEKEEIEKKNNLKTLKDFARLDTMVTVIDGYNFLPNLNSISTLKEKYNNKYTIEKEDDRTITNLLIDQIEFSNVILINKIELLQTEEIEKVKSIISILNPNAAIYTCSFSKIPLNAIINTNLFDFDIASKII